jgi:hypothetical protein
LSSSGWAKQRAINEKSPISFNEFYTISWSKWNLIFVVIKETIIVDVDVVENKNKNIYIYVNENVLIILTKEMFISTISGTTLNWKNIKTKVYRINLQRTMKIDKCYKCNMKRHLLRTCCTPKHLRPISSIHKRERKVDYYEFC